MLEISSLHMSFAGNKVLNGFSYSFQNGKKYAILGPNGSGKTTLFNIINGFLRADKGTINLKGENINSYPPYKIAELGIARTFQDLRLLLSLTVEQNIFIAIQNKTDEHFPHAFFPRTDADVIEKTELLINRFNLRKFKNSKAGEISYGQQKLLTLAMAMVNDFNLLLIDEPIAGVQPKYRDEIATILINLEKTVIFIEHNTSFIQEVTSNVLFLDGGAIVVEGNINTLRNNPVVQEAYL